MRELSLKQRKIKHALNLASLKTHPAFSKERFGMRHFAKYWFPVYAWAIVIFILSGLPSTGPWFFPHQDKLMHAAEYSIFGVLLTRALRHSGYGLTMSRCCIIAIAVSTAYGLGDEIRQLFISYRDFSLADLAFDGIGSCLGVLLYGKSR